LAICSHPVFTRVRAGCAESLLKSPRIQALADTTIYFDLGDSVSGTSALAAGSVPLPPGITADASLDVTAWTATLAASFRALASADSTVDLFAGARVLDAKAELGWSFSVDLGPFSGPLRQGTVETQNDAWDAIVGIKGAHAFGSRDQWFVPYYLDVGTGDSDITWQAAAGVGYGAEWGDAFLTWRHLEYEFPTDRLVESLEFDGPTLGIAISW
jgi:hypothetical protein